MRQDVWMRFDHRAVCDDCGWTAEVCGVLTRCPSCGGLSLFHAPLLTPPANARTDASQRAA